MSMEYHATWAVPLVVGLAASVFVVRSRRSTESRIYACFGWALLTISLGYLGVYINWRLLLHAAGVGHEMSFETFLEATVRSAFPGVVALASTVPLLVIATVIRSKTKTVRPSE